MKLKSNNRGFTLIELVLVIVILGVLAVSALPNIFNISLTTARTNSRDAVVGATDNYKYDATAGTFAYQVACP